MLSTLTTLDADHVLQASPTTKKQNKKIKKLFVKNTELTELANLINAVLEIKENFKARAGLSEQEFNLLKELGEKRKKLKARRKQGETSINLINDIMENANQLQPLRQTLEWWTNATEKFNSSEYWDLIFNSTKEAKEIEKIIALKKEWKEHQSFACYSSQNLQIFYKDYLLPLIDLLKHNIEKFKKYPALRSYLEKILAEAEDLQQAALMSMLKRLQCTVFFEHIACDDILYLMREQIQTWGNIKLKTKGNVPALRCNLTPDMTNDFVNFINQANQPRHAKIKDQFLQLDLYRYPKEWPLIHTDVHPTLIYFSNQFPVLLSQVILDNQITTTLLTTDSLKNEDFILRKLQFLCQFIKHASPELTNVNVLTLIMHQINQYNKLVKSLYNQLESTFELQFNSLLSDLINDKSVSEIKIKNLQQKRVRIDSFASILLKQNTSWERDCIVLLAQALVDQLVKQTSLSYSQLENIVKFLTTFYPTLTQQEVKEITNLISQAATRPLLDQETDELAKEIILNLDTVLFSHYKTHFAPIFENKKLLQQVRFITLKKYIVEKDNFSKTSLGKEISAYNDTKNKDVIRLFFTDFLGKENILPLVNLIESEINEFPNFEKNNPDQAMQIIDTLKPLTIFYLAHGRNKETLSWFSQFEDIENRIQVDKQLAEKLKEKNFFGNLNKENEHLQYILLSLVNFSMDAEQQKIKSQLTINQKLETLNQTHLVALETIIKNDCQFSFQILAFIANVLYLLISPTLKQLLLKANEAQLGSNLYWLKLINHLDNAKTIRYLEEAICHTQDIANADAAFFETISFASRFITLKRTTQFALKHSLLKEAGIEMSQINLEDKNCLASALITNTHLLNLWKLCAEKLKKEQFPLIITPRFFHVMIKFMSQIADIILSRSEKHPKLLLQFANLLTCIPTIYVAAQSLSENIRTSGSQLTLRLWPTPNQTEQIMEPLYEIDKTVFLMQLQKELQSYVKKFIPQSKLSEFKKMYEDEKFGQVAHSIQLDQFEIMNLLSINNETSLIMIDALKVAACLHKTIKEKGRFKLLIDLLNHLMSQQNITAEHKKFLENCHAKLNDYVLPSKRKSLTPTEENKRFSFALNL